MLDAFSKELELDVGRVAGAAMRWGQCESSLLQAKMWVISSLLKSP